MASYKVFKEDSEDLGFVFACLLSHVISPDEFQKWVLWVIQEQEPPPTDLVDLVDFQGPPFHLIERIGFVPVWSASDKEKGALMALAAMRGVQSFESCPDNEEGASPRIVDPAILEKFRALFPFIVL